MQFSKNLVYVATESNVFPSVMDISSNLKRIHEFISFVARLTTRSVAVVTIVAVFAVRYALIQINSWVSRVVSRLPRMSSVNYTQRQKKEMNVEHKTLQNQMESLR
jgi:hypothetical protein